MPREIDCPRCEGTGKDGFGTYVINCPDCKNGKIKLYTEAELQERIQQEREEVNKILREAMSHFKADDGWHNGMDTLMKIYNRPNQH